MNILFVSNLSGNLSVGPSYSVPAQIKAQSELDNVFWINTSDRFRDEWKEIGVPYISGKKWKKITLKEVAARFAVPDFVFFEGCYNYPFMGLAGELQKQGIPYAIVPRSQLTTGALKNKSLKKRVMNSLYFNKFIGGARAIQYLTENEAADSSKWKTEGVIIPNGIDQREYKEKTPHPDGKIEIVYIGRIDIYQKGMDLLINALSQISDYLEERHVTVELYGQPTEGDLEKLNTMISDRGIQDLVHINKPVFGEEKFSVLERADLFIMTSRFEGLPMGLIEALSFSCPCLVTDGTNLAQEIRDHNAGWVLSSEPSIMAKDIERAISDLGSCYGDRSRGAYELSKSYMWKDIARITHEMCERLIRNS